MQSRRLDRLGGQIQEEVSDIILRKLRDPRIGFVTVTKVRVSADLSYASIYISVMGGAEDIDRSLESLEGASSFIRSEMGKRLKIRHIPEIRFHYDDTEIKGARIDSLLKRLKESRDDRDPQVDS
ncbi:MAG: 30S ribosome-binding factor RbfA [Candidatus Eisenbacteria bacterium]